MLLHFWENLQHFGVALPETRPSREKSGSVISCERRRVGGAAHLSAGGALRSETVPNSRTIAALLMSMLAAPCHLPSHVQSLVSRDEIPEYGSHEAASMPPIGGCSVQWCDAFLWWPRHSVF